MLRFVVVATCWVLLFPAAATAQDTSFEADVHGGPQDLHSCTARLCGDAALAGFGEAAFTRVRTASRQTSKSCEAHTAVDTFTLPDDSALVLTVEGTGCAQGRGAPNVSGAAQIHGSWTVRETTGIFAGFIGAGTMSLRFHGERFTAQYAGTLHH
jgi:hypothetical protein